MCKGAAQAVTVEPELKTMPKFSTDERIIHLNKFEVLMLTPNQLEEFRENFSKRRFKIDEPMFQSWLTLKLASIPSESEALQRVLKAHTASNIPKRVNKRKTNTPVGVARYNPASPEWVEILTQQQENKKRAPPKSKKVSTSKVDPKKVDPPKVTSKKVTHHKRKAESEEPINTKRTRKPLR